MGTLLSTYLWLFAPFLFSLQLTNLLNKTSLLYAPAIRDYWGVDDKTVVIVADYFGGSGQLLKFNVGPQVDRLLPPRFWSILSAKYGNTFYVRKNSESDAIVNSVDAIRYCLLQGGCATPPKDAESIF